MGNPSRIHDVGWGLLFLSTLLLSCCSTNGSLLFHRYGCIQCHRFQGKGGMRGPDLTTVGLHRSNEYIDSYLQDPRGVDPHARMPAFPELSWQERRALIAYLKQ